MGAGCCGNAIGRFCFAFFFQPFVYGRKCSAKSLIACLARVAFGGWGFSSRGGIFDPVWLPPTSTWREPRFEARSAARSARTGIVCDGRGIPAACRESCWQVRRAEDEAALCNLTQQSSKPRGSERGRPPSRLQWRRGRSQRGRGAAVVPRPRLRPPIKAAIFLSIRGLSGGVGTQRHPARTGEKGRLLLQQSSLGGV